MDYEQKVIVGVDLDGTIANLDHRRHYLERKPKDWKSFFAAMGEDQPIGFVVDLLRAIHSTWPIFLFTGRPITYLDLTVTWLHKIRCPYDRLMMRGQNLHPEHTDWRPDHVIKQEMLDEVRAQGFTVLFVIDDRPSVIEMWRKNGVPCLAMDDAEWQKAGLR